MIFGVLLKGINTCNSLNGLDFLFEFIPQMFFMLSTFGYMIFLIIYKWNINWDLIGLSKAPVLINTMI